MNTFSIVGKITDMPILKETTNGLKTCELPLRVQRNFPNSEGMYENADINILNSMFHVNPNTTFVDEKIKVKDEI